VPFEVPFELSSDDSFEASSVDSLVEDPLAHPFEDPWLLPSDSQETAGFVGEQNPEHHRTGLVEMLPSAALILAVDQNYLEDNNN